MLESTIALALVFAVLVGLLASLTAGIRGVVTGRQRGAALALANEVLEQARGRGYAEIGHDLDSDPTLPPPGDPLITGASPAFTYGVEPLAGSTVDAGASAGLTSNPLFPFSPHRWDSAREGTTYTTWVYVTQVAPASGDPYKRVTVKVTWSPAQYASAARSVTLSTFLFDVRPPPDPRLVGEAEADSGSFTVTGSLGGIGLSEARVTLPYASGRVDSGFTRTARGFASTARSQLTLTSGSLTGCSVSGLVGECQGAKAETGSDNDGGTAPKEHERILPLSNAGGVVSAGTPLSMTLGSGDAESLATARSCWACFGTGPDDDDRLPFQWARSSGPADMSVDFKAGSASGKLLSLRPSTTGCAIDCARVAVDRDVGGSGSARMRSTASASYPAIELATFPGFPGMVKVGPASVSASAESGPLALPPSVGGGAVTVEMYDNTVVAGYKTLTVIPGSPSPLPDETSHAEGFVNGAFATMDATVHWNPAVTPSVPDPKDVTLLTEAQAGLTNWLFVEIHLQVWQGSNKEADLWLHLDYGRISARATYEAV